MTPVVKRKVSGMGTRLAEGAKKSLYIVDVPKRKKRISKRKRELREITDKGGRKVRRWVNPEFHGKEATLMNWPKGRPYEQTPDFHYTAPVKYDKEFAERQALRRDAKQKSLDEFKEEPKAEKTKDGFEEYLTHKGDEPRFKQPTIDKFDRRMRERLAKAKDLKEYKKMQKEFARVIKSKVYQKAKETGAKTYNTAMKAMDDKSQVEAFAKKKSKPGVSIKLGEIDLKGAFQMMVILIVIILVLSFLSWLSSLF